MESKDPSDPAEAMRERIARYARDEMDLSSEAGQAAARRTIESLRDLEHVDQEKRAFKLSLATGWSALFALVVVDLLCAAAIVWILVRDDLSGALQIASLTASATGFSAISWSIRKRAAKQLEAITPPDQDAAEKDPGADEG